MFILAWFVLFNYIPLRMLKQVVIVVFSHCYLVFGRSIEKDISHNIQIFGIEYGEYLQNVNIFF